MNNQIYLGLVHHPVLNKRGDIVTTSVTNLDIHDISRSCRTFGVLKYYIITPLKPQHELVQRILGHWEKNESSSYNPDRQEALKNTFLKNSVEEAINDIENTHGVKPVLAVTGANFKEYTGETQDLLRKLNIDNRPCLLLFGTGWGLSKEIVDKAEFLLNPIWGRGEEASYNHLSVRSAVAIYLDRLARSEEHLV